VNTILTQLFTKTRITEAYFDELFENKDTKIYLWLAICHSMSTVNIV